MYRIRKLDIRRFRGLAAPVSLTFGDRYHLIVGDNGAGKTNLLKLLAMVTRMDFSPLVDESFDLSWEGETDEGGKVEFAVTRTVSRMHSAEAGGRPSAKVAWSWTVAMDLNWAEVKKSSAAEDGVAGSIEDPCGRGWGANAASILQPWALDWQATRADEALGGFEALLGGGAEPGTGDLESFAPGVVAKLDGREVYGFGPGVTLPESWPTAAASGDYQLIDSRSLPWLERVRLEFGAESLTLRPKFEHRRPVDAGVDIIQFRGCDIQISFSPHVQVSQDKLSFGQKRLLGLRYYLATSPEAPAIIDELSNGLHHTWVESLVKDLEPRQSFLATQNPLLMDSVWWDSAEEAGHGIILCTQDAEHRWVWRQLDASEAVTFYDAWRTGIQQIHEVLKTEGWW